MLEYDSDKCSALRHQLPDIPVIEGDGTTHTANDEAVQVAADAFGGLDTLVNCVGIFDFYRRLQDIPRANRQGVRRDVSYQRPESYPLSQGCSAGIDGPGRRLDHPHRVRFIILSRTWRPAVCRVEVRGAWPRHRTGSRTRAEDPCERCCPRGTLNTDLRGLDSLDLGARRLDAAPDRARELAARTPLNVALSGHDHAMELRLSRFAPLPRAYRRNDPPRRRFRPRTCTPAQLNPTNIGKESTWTES